MDEEQEQKDGWPEHRGQHMQFRVKYIVPRFELSAFDSKCSPVAIALRSLPSWLLVVLPRMRFAVSLDTISKLYFIQNEIEKGVYSFLDSLGIKQVNFSEMMKSTVLTFDNKVTFLSSAHDVINKSSKAFATKKVSSLWARRNNPNAKVLIIYMLINVTLRNLFLSLFGGFVLYW